MKPTIVGVIPRLRGAVAALAVAVAVSACEDGPTDPMSGLVAGETGGALALGVELPSPRSLIGAGEVEGPAHGALMRWEESWDLPVEAGRAERAGLYDPLAKSLRGVGAEEVGVAVNRLGAALGSVSTLEVERLPDDMRASILNADAFHRRATRALTMGDVEGALEDMLRGSDALREVSPEAVARALVADAEGTLRRVLETDAYSEVDVERSRRLLRGARSALESGDYVRSIRRAYYARRLLDPR